LVANRIELDLGKAGGGEFGDEFGLKFVIVEAGRLFGGDLDEGLFAQMADADDAKAVTTDSLLGLLDGGEAGRCDGQAGGEAGRKAGGGGFFGDFQPGFFGEGPDIGLGQAGLAEGGSHGKLSGGGATGPDFPGVVKVFPIGEDGDPAELGQLLHPLEKFRAAEVTAVGRVGGVGGVVQFQRFENFDGQAMFPGEGQGGGMFGARETGGVAEDPGNLRSEDLVGGPKEEGGVDPARVGDQGRGPGSNDLMEPLFFGGEIGICGHEV
jgi:hypothetical protein